MFVKRLALLSFVAFVLLSQAASCATLNVTNQTIDTSIFPNWPYVNTNKHVYLLNLTFRANVSYVNLTAIKVHFNSTASISANETGLRACAYNENFDVISCNSTWTGNYTWIPLGIKVDTSNVTVYLGYDLNKSISGFDLSVVYRKNISLYVYNTSSIESNATIVQNTSAMPYHGLFVQVQDLHAVAEIKPHYVDTNVKNQSFVYIVNTTGFDKIDVAYLSIPLEFSNVNLVHCYYDFGGGSTQSDSECSLTGSISGNKIVLDPATDFEYLKLNFTADTNQSGEFTRTFNANISGGNLTNVQVQPKENDWANLNVTTKQLLNITGIEAIDAVAIPNGTDYWLFKIDVNLTAPVNGTLQFKLTNWKSAGNQSKVIPLVNESEHHFAFLSMNENAVKGQSTTNNTDEVASGVVWIENEYPSDASYGLSITYSGSPFSLYLKMIIPADPSLCCFDDWFAIFSMIFRSSAS